MIFGCLIIYLYIYFEVRTEHDRILLFLKMSMMKNLLLESSKPILPAYEKKYILPSFLKRKRYRFLRKISRNVK